MDLYDRPVNRFVAEFLGTVNILDGHTVKKNGQTEFHTNHGIIVPFPENGETRSIMFRPQNLTIHPEDTGTAPTGMEVLSGIVRHKEFLGSIIRYSVEVSGHDILVDDSHQGSETSFSIGTSVNLFLDQSQIAPLQ